MKIILRIILLPFAILYDGITRLRNHLYNIGSKKSIHFDTVVISIGNLNVGGTGKTPHVEYLIRLLKGEYKMATLSRGYGRKTKGFILADERASATTLGDEPFQFFLKFNKTINVAVGEERVLAIPSILLEIPDNDIILLDDAFQHRKVVPDFNILLTDYNSPFYKDFLLPAGRLREARTGAKRADAVIITKCPVKINESERKIITETVLRYKSSPTPVFFTTIKYGAPASVTKEIKIDKNTSILLLAGIANAQPLIEYVKSTYNLFKKFEFKDHYSYSESSIKSLLVEFAAIKNPNKVILTTEKDVVKLKEPRLLSLFADVPLFYLPIEVDFIEDKEGFDKMILETIKKRLNDLNN